MQKKIKILILLAVAFVILCFLRTSPAILFLDQALYSLAKSLSASQIWVHFWWGITCLGFGVVVSILVGVILIINLIKKRDLMSVFLIPAAIFISYVNVWLKQIFALQRPVSLFALSHEVSYTFPSGHAFNSVIIFFLTPRLIRLFFFPDFLLSKTAKFFLSRPFMMTGMVLLSLSRVFLGAHWFSDVIGGMLHGAIWANLVLLVVDRSGQEEI